MRVSEKWRNENMRKKLPMIKWENLKIEVVEERFAGVVEEKLREEQGKVKQDMTGWPRVTEVVLGAAKDVCGEAAKAMENQRMVGTPHLGGRRGCGSFGVRWGGAWREETEL